MTRAAASGIGVTMVPRSALLSTTDAGRPGDDFAVVPLADVTTV